MIDFANIATEFWSTNTRSSLEAAANFKREKVFANDAVTKVSVAVDALNQEIKKRYPSNPAELNAHIDAIDLARSAVVEAAAGLRRAIRETRVLEPGFSAELGANVDAVQAKLGASCAGYLVSLREISRQWQLFSGEMAGATNDGVTAVRQELAQLDVRKAAVASNANSNGERLIRDAETTYKQAIQNIDASTASTYYSRSFQYWATLVILAGGGAIAAWFYGTAMLGSVFAAAITAGTGGFVVWGLDRSIERVHAARKVALRAQAESVRSEDIRRFSREQEDVARGEIERIGEDARKLQRKLEDAISNLAESRKRGQETARDLASQERIRLEQSWGPLANVTTEVIQLFQLRHAKVTEAAGQLLGERLRSGMRKCQAEIETAVDGEIREPSFKYNVGSQNVLAPDELHPFLEGSCLIRVPLVIDLMDSCYLKHDSSLKSVDAARRLASGYAMEIWRRADGARVTIFDLASLGSGYGELLSIGSDVADVTLLAAARDLGERLSEFVRTAAARNRAAAARRERDWLNRGIKKNSVSEPVEILLLEVPRAGIGSEQRAQIEALLGVGPSAGVILIVMDAKDRKDDRGMPLGAAREIEILGSSALERGYSLDIPDRDDLARKARVILDTPVDDELASAVFQAPTNQLSSNFAEFMDAVVPAASRWKSDLANTNESISIPIGVSDSGDVTNLVFDDGAPHAILLGGTGSGKTNFLHTLIQAGCLKFSPDELRLYLADLKSGVSFEPYARLNCLGSHFGAVACTSSVVFGAVLINAAKEEMQRRYDFFKVVQRRQGESIKGLAHYRKLASPSDEKLPRLLVIIDEFQALFDDAARRRQTLENLITLLKQGRQVGVHVMLATQSLRGKAGDLDQALSQIHTRMILPAAMSDGNSIFRSLSLAQQSVDYCSKPGKCFMSRDFGEKVGSGFTNPESKGNSFFFSTLESLTTDSPPPLHQVPVVWSDDVGSLRDNFLFRFMRGSETPWYLGVPYSAEHALAVPLENGVTTAMVAVDDRGHARALVASLLLSLSRSFDGIDVFWLQQKKDSGPLRQRDFESMAKDLGLIEVKYLDSLRSLAAVLTGPAGAGDCEQRTQVAILPDVTTLGGKRGTSGSSWAGALTGGGESDVSSDIDHLLSIVSLSSGPPKILLMLAVSSNDLLGGHSKSATDLASIRVASGRLKGSRMREFLRVSDLPEMADEDLVVTTDQNRHPKVFRPFQENWSS